MKIFKFTTIFALLAAALVSCNKDDQSEGNYPKDGAVRINASVSAPLTRAENTTTFTGSNLSLFLDYGAGEKYNANNILWNNNSGEWTSSSLMLWKNSITPVNIYAYSPFRAGEGYAPAVIFRIPSDQTEGIENADFVYGCIPGFIPENDLDEAGAVNITLRHCLVKLTLNISKNNEFDGTDVTVKGVKLRQTADAVKCNISEINVESAVTANTGAQAMDIAMHNVHGDSVFEAIFFPYLGQKPGAKMITVDMSNGRSYSYTVPTEGISFESGCAYEMNLKVGKDKLTLSGVSISGWGSEERNITGGDAED